MIIFELEVDSVGFFHEELYILLGEHYPEITALFLCLIKIFYHVGNRHPGWADRRFWCAQAQEQEIVLFDAFSVEFIFVLEGFSLEHELLPFSRYSHLNLNQCLDILNFFVGLDIDRLYCIAIGDCNFHLFVCLCVLTQNIFKMVVT